MIKALIFDCDGVLVDTERDAHRVGFNLAFRQMGIDAEWDVDLYGRLLLVAGGKERMRAYFDEFGWPVGADSAEAKDELILALHKTKTQITSERVSSLPVRPGMLSMDARATDVVADWQARGVHAAIRPRILQTPYAGQPPALLRWIKQHEPEVYACIGAALLAKDYIKYRLTGAFTTDLSDISATGLLDLRRRDYAPELLEAYGIAEIAHALPPIIESTAPAGQVTAVKQIDQHIPPTSFVSIVGPSGCGKSTLLAVISGLQKATSGTVSVAGRPVSGRGGL